MTKYSKQLLISAKKNNFIVPEVVKRKVSKKINNNDENQYFPENKFDEMKINVYYSILDDLLGEINNRFLELTLDLIDVVGNLSKLQPNEEDYLVLKEIFNIPTKNLECKVKLLQSIKGVPIGSCTQTLFKWLDWLINSTGKAFLLIFMKLLLNL